jgi:CRISPR-associated protein Cas1
MRLFDQWLDLSGKPDLGLVQGAPISPILANLYLDDLDEEAAAMGARIVRFADDFVLLAKSREKAERLHVELGKLLAARGLRLNPGKSGVVDFDQGFSFLGRHFLKSMVLEDRYALDEQDWDAALEQALGKERSGGSPSGQERQRRFRNVDFGEATVLSSAPVPADAAPVLADPLWNRRGQDGLRDLEPGVRTLHLHGKGRMLTARDASFVVREGGEELWHCGASRVGRIDIGPHALIADSGLRHALSHDVPVRFVDGRGTTIGWLHGAQSNRAERQLSQARHALDPELCIATAREFVRGKIQNQRGVLQRWLSNARKAERKGAPQRAGLKPLLERSIALLKVEVGKTAGAEARTHLLGIEGAATRIFLQAFRKGLIAWSFGKRQRRPAPDEVNVVLNWLSYLLMRDVEVAIQRHDLHPGFAFLHTTQDYRDALAFDLIEEFRPTCVEALALALFNSAELQSHFFFREPAAGICRLTTDGSSLVVRRFEEWMARDRLSHPDRDKAQNWRGVIDAQVMRLVRAVEGGAAYRAYKVKA